MVYQLKIKLKNVSKPTVWRRILVPAETPLDLLHQMIQDAFGWFNIHLYSFSPSGYGSKPWIEQDPEIIPATDSPFRPKRKVQTAYDTLLSDMINQEGQKFTYIYDFGDDWIHEITLEKIDKFNIAPSAVLLTGKGACPPENCGGPPGYEPIKKVMSDRKHPEYSETKKWIYQTVYEIDAEEYAKFEEFDDEEDEFDMFSLWNPNIYELKFTKELFDDYFKDIYD